MKRGKAQKTAILGRYRNGAVLDRHLRRADLNAALKIIKEDGGRQRFDGQPVRDQRFRTIADGPSVFQLKALPRFYVVRSRVFRDASVFKKREKLGQTLRPSLFEIDVLRMRDLQGSSVRREAQGNDKAVFLYALGGLNRNGDLIPDTLLLDAAGCCNEEEPLGFVTNGIFKDALPIIPAFEAQNISEHLIA